MTNEPTDLGQPIPESRLIKSGGTCYFCDGPDHYGFCDPMRAYNTAQEKRGMPLVNPKVRHG